jgi:hypothetical protein
MKKQLLFFSFSLIGLVASAQTIVPTTAQNKKVILEEFTGIHCVYCPQGHAIAQGMKNADPNNVFLINVHVGSFATPGAGEPDFRTPYGTAIASQSNLSGYPAGTVNRTEFAGLQQNGTGTAMSRGNWSNAGNQIKTQSSYVNVAVESSIDVPTNTLTIHVEGYYTGSSPVSTNKLNVALLQNNTKGPQTGGNAGNEYVHQHRLVDMITGQWGEDIITTTLGTFVDRTYTYTIPASYNSIPVDIADLEVVAFISETQQKIINGYGSTPTYTGIVGNDVNLKSIDNIASQCLSSIGPKVKIQNISPNPLTSLPITYDINSGTPQVYNWTGSLGVMQSMEIQLPAYSYYVQATNNVSVSVPSDANLANNTLTTSFNKSAVTTSSLTLVIHTDAYGDECSWNIKNSAGTTVLSNGFTTYGNNITYNIPISLPTDDCYKFTLNDSYGDGGGPVSLIDSNNVTVYSTTGTYGSGASRSFATGAYLGVDKNELEGFSMYPNPTEGILNINAPSKVDVFISDVTGKTVYSQKDIIDSATLDLTFLQSGIYFAKVKSETAEKNEKIIIK